MKGSSFELEVIRHGSSSKQFYHEGKYYVEGKQGDEFSVKIKNNTSRRVLAVLTVDGLSAMDGKTGSFDSTGYILDSFNSITVPGWRLSNKEVAHFEFARSDKSYAAGKGKGIHNGVIGCAFFYEKEHTPVITYRDLPDAFPKWPWPKYELPYQPWYPTWTVTTSGNMENNFNLQAQASSGSNNMAQNLNKGLSDYNNSSNINRVLNSSLGTGFGDKTEHRVVSVGFERASSIPIEVLTVYYDTRQGLKDRGIDVEGYTEIASPFPGSQKEYNKFCEPPKGWDGWED